MDIKDYTSLVISTAAFATSILTFYKLSVEKKNRKIEAHIRYQNIFREVQYQGANSCVLPNIDGKYAEYKKILENYQSN